MVVASVAAGSGSLQWKGRRSSAFPGLPGHRNQTLHLPRHQNVLRAHQQRRFIASIRSRWENCYNCLLLLLHLLLHLLLLHLLLHLLLLHLYNQNLIDRLSTNHVLDGGAARHSLPTGCRCFPDEGSPSETTQHHRGKSQRRARQGSLHPKSYKHSKPYNNNNNMININ